jgi:hypothetical protein
MRQYRRRRRWKRLLVRVELDATEIGVLVSRGYLNPREKENLEAIHKRRTISFPTPCCFEGFVHAAALKMPRKLRLNAVRPP